MVRERVQPQVRGVRLATELAAGQGQEDGKPARREPVAADLPQKTRRPARLAGVLAVVFVGVVVGPLGDAPPVQEGAGSVREAPAAGEVARANATVSRNS